MNTQIQQEIHVLHSFREFNDNDCEVRDYIYELMIGDGVCFLYIDLYQWYADMQLDSIRRRFNGECFNEDVWEGLRFGFLITGNYRRGVATRLLHPSGNHAWQNPENSGDG